MKYITPKEAAEKWNISQRRVHTLCKQGRISNAERHGWTWLIPDSAKKPLDARIKSGRYCKEKQEPSATIADGAIIWRNHLVQKLSPQNSKLTYIHAGAGYGKTSLLMQYAEGRTDVAWLTMDARDNDILFFLQHLENTIKRKLKQFKFTAMEYTPFTESTTFIQTVLSDLLMAIGRSRLSVIMDDVHVLQNDQVIELITGWVIACPSNISILMASRNELWNGLFRLKMSGKITELTRCDLVFSRKEAELLWGFFDEEIYTATEGWSLAIQSYRLAVKDGQPLSLSRLDVERDLYHYLLDTISKKLPEHILHFLKATCFLPEMDAKTCDQLLDVGYSQDVLEYLICHNIFTSRISAGSYRYHALFSLFLQQNDEGLGRETLRQAMKLNYRSKNYEQAAEYALLLQDSNMVQRCIGRLFSKHLNWYKTRQVKKYLDYLEEQSVTLSTRSMLAKGMLLSDQGNFFQAETYLRTVVQHLGQGDKQLYLLAMTHMARVLRNKVSFEESTRCLDTLIPLLQDAPMQDWYFVMIEKIHNLTLTSHLFEALQLVESMISRCLSVGDYDVKAWFERYLTSIYFYMGDFKSCLSAYEKSLTIPDSQQEWLMRHSIGLHAAKAYQMTGQEEKVLPLAEAELNRIKQLELYEEHSFNYLIYAEILHSIELLKCYQGLAYDYSVSNHYLEIAEKYAVLNRSTHDHYIFVKIWRLCSLILAQPEKIIELIQEALSIIDSTTPAFQSFAYGRMANALDILGQNSELCKEFFHKCIQIGEQIGCYAYSTVAHGRLAAIFLREGSTEKVQEYTERFLQLSEQFKNIYYIRFRKLFESVLNFASENAISPDFTREMMTYGGYMTELVYVHTLGNFYITPFLDREHPVRIRTQKARELLAYLLEHRNGATREQIFADLWENSESDITRLFHTRRGEIRKAFESLGAKNPILYENGLYFLNMEEILCDYDLFLQATVEYRQQLTIESAKKMVNFYTGRYLDDMEALWSESTRLSLEDSFLEAAEALMEHYRDMGERSKAIELLRRCTGSSHHGHRYETI